MQLFSDVSFELQENKLPLASGFVKNWACSSSNLFFLIFCESYTKPKTLSYNFRYKP